MLLGRVGHVWGFSLRCRNSFYHRSLSVFLPRVVLVTGDKISPICNVIKAFKNLDDLHYMFSETSMRCLTYLTTTLQDLMLYSVLARIMHPWAWLSTTLDNLSVGNSANQSLCGLKIFNFL